MDESDINRAAQKAMLASRQHDEKGFWFHPIFLTLMLIAYALINFWSAHMTGQGLIGAKNLAHLDDSMVYVFASLIQFVIAAGMLYLALMWKESWGKRFMTIPCYAIVIFCAGFEVYHAVIAQVKTSQGVALLRKHEDWIDARHARLTSLSTEMVTLYRDKTESFRAGREDARNGRDRTGVAKCGEICRDRDEKYEMSRAYADLAQPIPSVPVGGAQVRFLALELRSAALSTKFTRLEEYLRAVRQAGIIPAGMKRENERLDLEIKQRSGMYNDMAEISERTLAMEEAFDVWARLLHGQSVNKLSLLAVAYGCIPMLIVFVLGVLIRFIAEKSRRTADADPQDLEVAIKNEDRKFSLLKVLKAKRRERALLDAVGA